MRAHLNCEDHDHQGYMAPVDDETEAGYDDDCRYCSDLQGLVLVLLHHSHRERITNTRQLFHGCKIGDLQAETQTGLKHSPSIAAFC